MLHRTRHGTPVNAAEMVRWLCFARMPLPDFFDSLLMKYVESYGSEEHGQHHDCDVYDNPDRQHSQLAHHILTLLSGFTVS
jgi:hypothetical protein